MAAHLDRWAGDRLDGPDGWAAALTASRHWLDYSARNQILLASYGVDGPVAGAETWRLVPSAVAGRVCAVRGGEHGWPVRVPITTASPEPNPYLGGSRPTRSPVERWEWRPVFSVTQLARQPESDALMPAALPQSIAGDDAATYLAAVRKAATATAGGELSRSDDPHQVLSEGAARLRRSDKRPELEPVLRDQVAWLVGDRMNLASGPLPAFDPSKLARRERWERLQDVLEPARKLTAALGVVYGIDLCASPLPRMEIIDDRVVPASRRHRLPPASVAQLPIGRWVEVGPYMVAEWASRGEQGSGRGGYFRLNESAYLVVIERGDGAAWRLEDIASPAGDGLAAGAAAGLEQAKSVSVTAMGARYPGVSTEPDWQSHEPQHAAGRWEPIPGDRLRSAELCRLGADVTVYSVASPSGKWMPAVNVGPSGDIERLPLVSTQDEARQTAELRGRQVLAMIPSPADLDNRVAALAADIRYCRDELAAVTGSRLVLADRERMTIAEPAELVELLGQAGVTPATTVAVLQAEQLETSVMAGLLPVIGVPMPDGIRALHDRWDLPRVKAAEALNATAAEMRAAGCTPVEIMGSRPRDVLRTLPSEPHLWELAAGTMAAAGHATGTIAAHLVAHAPTVDAFAAGLEVLAEEPSDGIGLAIRHGAHAEYVAGASEHYGLSPAETATVLTDGGATPQLVVETLWERCDHDLEATTALAAETAHLEPHQVARCLAAAGITETGIETLTPASIASSVFDIGDADSLLAMLPEPIERATKSTPTITLPAPELGDPDSLQVMGPH